MNALIVRASQRHIAAPLIRDHLVIHRTSHDSQHLIAKEKLRDEGVRLERHWKKMTMRAAIRVPAAGFQISGETRPKRIPASIYLRRREMPSEYAIALVLDLDLVLNSHQVAKPILATT